MISSSTKVRPFFLSATRVRAVLAILLSLALLSAASSQSTKPKPDRSATSAKIQELSQTVGSLEEHVKMLEQRVISLEEHPRPLIQPSNFNFFGAPWIQWASFWIQWATLIVGALVLCVYYRQMKAMMGQLETMKQQFAAAQQQVRISRNSATFDHVITLVGFLQGNEVRAARGRVIKDLDRKSYSAWSKDDLDDASTVCSSYSAVGYVLMELMKNEPDVINVFAAGWSPSILRCYEILEPHVREMRRQAGQEYWEGFDWLRDRAKAAHHKNT
jgi:hypothetical protein